MPLRATASPVSADPGAALGALVWVSPNAAVVAADDQHLYEVHPHTEPLRPHHLTPMPLAAPVISLAAYPLSTVAERIAAVGTGQECPSMLAAALANGTLQLFKLRISEDVVGGEAGGSAEARGSGGAGGSSSGRTVKIQGVKTVQKALSSPVSALCWMADASALVVGCEDGSLIVFSPSGEPRAQFSGLKGNTVRTLACTRGDTLMIGTTAGLYSFQLSSAQTPVLLDPTSVSAMAVIEETNSMLVAHDDGRIHCIGPSGNLLWVSSLSGVLGSGAIGNLGASTIGNAGGAGGPSSSTVGFMGAGQSKAGTRVLGSINEIADTPTAIAVAPNGTYALIGTMEGRISLMSLFNPVIIDELRFEAGAILNVCFSPDGNLALATTLCNKAIVVYTYGQKACSCTSEAVLSSPTTLEIWDETTNPPVHEELEAGSGISLVKMGYGHIIALSRSMVYSIEQPERGTFQSGTMMKIGTSSVLPVGESGAIGIDSGAGLTPPPVLVSLGENAFAVGDSAGVLHTFSYDMKQLGKMRHNSFYSSRTIAVNGGVVACVDARNPNIVNLFSNSGKKVGGAGGIKHIRPVTKVIIGHNTNNYGAGLGGRDSRRQRLVVVLDVSNEVWAYEVSPSEIGQACRLSVSGIYDVAFIEGTTALLLVTQEGLALHVCPTATLIDPGLTTSPIFGIKRLSSPMSTHITSAEAPKDGNDGYAVLQTSPSTYIHCRVPGVPLNALASRSTEELLTTCRAEPSTPLWTLAALLGAQAGDLVILKAAYSALSLLTRVRVVTKAQASDNSAEREAFVKVLIGDTEKALNILIANNRYKTAIQLCMELFMTERAARIAADSGDPALQSLVGSQ